MARDSSPQPPRKSQSIPPSTTAPAGGIMVVACPHCTEHVSFVVSDCGRPSTCPYCTKRFRLPKLPVENADLPLAAGSPAEGTSIPDSSYAGIAEYSADSAASTHEARERHRSPVKKKWPSDARSALLGGGVLVALIVAAGIITGRGCGSASTAPKVATNGASKSDPAKAEQAVDPIDVEWFYLALEYETNVVAADEKYKGKLLQGSIGYGPKISKGPFGGIYVVIPEGSLSVQFSFGAEQAGDVAKIDKAKKIRGICRGQVLSAIIFDKCELVFSTTAQTDDDDGKSTGVPAAPREPSNREGPEKR
jgi:hypothetical protein